MDDIEKKQPYMLTDSVVQDKTVWMTFLLYSFWGLCWKTQNLEAGFILRLSLASLAGS